MSERNVARFVADRRPSWKRLESLLAGAEAGQLDLPALDELDRAYRRATSDLSLARTSFPGSEVALYLAQLTGRAYATIYRTRDPVWPATRRFFTQGVPGAFASLRPFGLAAALILGTGLAAGAVATAADERVAETVAPAELVRGVRQGQIWTDSVLQVAPPSVVSVQILTNNISVTFSVFMLGVLLGLPTAFILFQNGFLIGSLGALCARYGLLGKFLTFILAHGLLELTIVCLAGGAGLALGFSLVEPGDLPRGEALRVRAGQGVRLVLGVAPALVLLGLVEGHVSPGARFPLVIKAALGLGLEAVFLTWMLRRSPAQAEGLTYRAGSPYP